MSLRFLPSALLCVALAACGGSGSPLPAELSVLSVTFVTSNDAPLDPSGNALPKNTWIRIEFTKAVDPSTVDAQTIRVRQGPGFGIEAAGFFEVDGAVVRFDSTRAAHGGPHPFGFDGPAAFRLQLRSIQEAAGVVRSVDGDPLALGVVRDFTTSDRYVVEGVPPRVLGARFLPAADPTTGVVPADATLIVDFSEVLHPDSLQLARHVVEPHATFDVRYADTPLNVAAGLDGRVVPGTLVQSPDGRSLEFRPFFSFGDQPYAFEVRFHDAIQDLARNPLANPDTLGPFVCDGTGAPPGSVLFEDFQTITDRDDDATAADWGLARPGVCVPPPVTTRDVFVLGSTYADGGAFSNVGTYFTFADPLNGSTFVGAEPPTAMGRRVQLSFPDTEIGPEGSIIALAWGPDRNATMAATYPQVQIEASFQSNPGFMVGSFSANAPNPTQLYVGPYTVVQDANVGNTPGLPLVPHKPGYGSPFVVPCQSAQNYNQPLYDYTGFVPWPALQNVFDWNPGGPMAGDQSLILDFRVSEGTDFQRMRVLFGHTAPCSGALGPIPMRRLLGVLGDDLALPRPITNQLVNPDPTIMDTQITISRFRTLAQSLFYTPPGDPSVSSGGVTFGTDSDYFPAVVADERPGATRVEIEYQGATAIDPDRQTPDIGQPFTPWTQNVDDCDGLPYIRWRIRFVGDYNNNAIPTVFSVQLPVRDAG